MSLLGMRRAPGLATLAAALSLVGWIPWSALMGLDDLAYDITQVGSTPQFAALWAHFNGDAVMSTYLLIYIIGHRLSAVLIGVMLGRLRLIPAWAAWAFALTSPLTVLYLPVHGIVVKNALTYLICALWIVGAVPAALAMLKGSDQLAVGPSDHPVRGAISPASRGPAAVGGAHGSGARGHGPGRVGSVQRGDRTAAVHEPGDGQDARQPCHAFKPGALLLTTMPRQRGDQFRA
jgi:hypothetical protein